MKAIKWKVEGMDCSTCALNIHRYLEKEGMKEIRVNFATGDVQFQNAAEQEEAKLQKGISDLGYTVVGTDAEKSESTKEGRLSPQLLRFLICLPPTLLLLFSHTLAFLSGHIEWLHHH